MIWSACPAGPDRTALPFVPLLTALALAALRPEAHTQQPTPQQPTQPSPQQLKQLRDARLLRPVFQMADWHLDVDAALAKAKAEDKPVLAYFTRSYSPSKESDDLENGALSAPAFANFAKGCVLFLHCASRTEGEPRPRLLQELGLTTQPTLCFLDPDGKLVAHLRELSLGSITGNGQRVKALIDARSAARKGGPVAAKALFLAELDLDLLTAEQIQARLPTVQLTEAEKTDLDRKFVDAEIVSLLQKASTLGNGEVGRRIAAIHAAGRRPNERYAFSFWGWLLAHAAAAKDGDLADQAFIELTRREDPHKDPRRNIQTREQWEKQRAEAKGK